MRLVIETGVESERGPVDRCRDARLRERVPNARNPRERLRRNADVQRERSREMLPRYAECRGERRDREIATRAENGAYRRLDCPIERARALEPVVQERLEGSAHRRRLVAIEMLQAQPAIGPEIGDVHSEIRQLRRWNAEEGQRASWPESHANIRETTIATDYERARHCADSERGVWRLAPAMVAEYEIDAAVWYDVLRRSVRRSGATRPETLRVLAQRRRRRVFGVAVGKRGHTQTL